MKATHTDRRRILGVLVSLAFLPVVPLSAQTEAGERGRLVIGYRHIVGDTSSSKFNEYRHIPRVYVQSFRFNLESYGHRPHFFSFQSRESVEKDQSHMLSVGRYGLYRLDLKWDQAPHAFTNSGRSLFLGPANGVFVIPDSIRTGLQAQPSTAGTLLTAASPFAVTLRRNAGRARFLYTPTSAWALQFEYSHERQFGFRPFGTTTNAFTNIAEVPEPIHYRTRLLGAKAEYANEKWGIQVGYASSFFNNRVSDLVWDNPFRTADTSTAGSRGRLDLYPSNSAHSLSIAGAASLGGFTRLMVSIVPGWMRQNDPFLPFTINTAVAGVPALPAPRPDGSKQTLAMNYTLTSSPWRAWQFTTRYRSYDYNNNTPSLLFASGYVRTDASMVTTARRSLPYGYDTKNLNWDASWEFLGKQFFKFGYEWERFDRQHRDADTSDEHGVTSSLDLNPQKWILVRASYRHSRRAPKHYEPNESSYPVLPAMGQIHELRKFDQAERERNRAEALLQFTPTDTLSFTASYGTTQDRYAETLYGLLSDLTHNFALELTYSPVPSVSLFADYTREKFRNSQRSRQRQPGNDSANNDWESSIRDLVDTWGTGLNLSLFRNRFSADAYYSLSAASGLIHTRALGSPTITGFLVTSAQNYPDTNNRYHQVSTTIRCRMSDKFIPRFDYRFERYDRIDFQIDRIQPYMVFLDSGTSTSVFLGADVPSYKAHILSFSLEYRF